MRRVVVIGAGFFGGIVARRLAERGVRPLVASRSGSGADLRVDADDARSVAATLRAGDVVVDTAGPWEGRSTAVLDGAVERGYDVIDLSESLSWAERVLSFGARAERGGVRLLPGCSAVAAVAGACVRASGMTEPRAVDLFLAPASAETASPATVRGFVRSLGAPIRTLRGGRLVTVLGYAEARRFAGSRRRGGLVESAAGVLLRRSWPTLERAELWVDPNVPLARAALSAVARLAPLATLARALAPAIDVRRLGRHDGVFAVMADDGGRGVATVLGAPRVSYRIATEPAVIAAESLARGDAMPAGVVPPHAQVDAPLLFRRLRELGIEIAER